MSDKLPLLPTLHRFRSLRLVFSSFFFLAREKNFFFLSFFRVKPKPILCAVSIRTNCARRDSKRRYHLPSFQTLYIYTEKSLINRIECVCIYIHTCINCGSSMHRSRFIDTGAELAPNKVGHANVRESCEKRSSFFFFYKKQKSGNLLVGARVFLKSAKKNKKRRRG